ncbi:DUF4468 domain-containing protein [Capnocytophaga canimorsus]|uniref:DUF4468 domain-containing protein n=1 Tax=Capnocytophaga canimorsus TaxID=28188 RepID=UPI0015622C6F|nr:DUF4468 domain-containing protein [Capnocytophaga canimorsus]
MKKIILLLFTVLSAFISVAQEERHLGELESIIEINLSKSLLYNNAQQWASTNDPTCTKKIEIQDGDNPSIVVKSVLINKSRNTSLTKFLAYKFIFTTKIDCKDGKYRRTISNPSVLVQDARDVNIKYASTKTLEDYMSELEAVARISENNFDKILEWGLDKVMDILFEKETIIKRL